MANSADSAEQTAEPISRNLPRNRTQDINTQIRHFKVQGVRTNAIRDARPEKGQKGHRGGLRMNLLRTQGVVSGSNSLERDEPYTYTWEHWPNREFLIRYYFGKSEHVTKSRK